MRVLHILSLIALTSLVGCGGSGGDDSDFSGAFIQFYNGAANSADTIIRSDDLDLGVSSYGDATANIELEGGSTDFELYYVDTDGQENNVADLNLDLTVGNKALIVMSGDFNSPDIATIDFQRSSLDEGFTLRFLSVVPEQSYDVYVADSGDPFEAANFATSLSFNEAEQVAFFDVEDNDPLIWDIDDYKVFITLPGSEEVIYESDNIDFEFLTDYVLIVRPNTGPNQNELVVDVVINSSFLDSFDSLLASAQFRVYNSLQSNDITTILTRGQTDQAQVDVASNELTEFASLDTGDYQVTVMDEQGDTLSSSGLLTLGQNEARTLVIYTDESEQVRTLNAEVSAQPQVFEHDINVVNLVPNVDDLILYFVRADETVDTADFSAANLDFATVRSESVLSDFYRLTLVREDQNDNLELLFISDLIAIDEETFYLITVEASDTQSSGFEVNLLR